MKARGRRLRYEAPAPTPEQFRTDDSEPWQTMSFTHSGIAHQLRYKRGQNMMWRNAGTQQILQLVIIAPLALSSAERLEASLRDPACLVCTDSLLDPRQIMKLTSSAGT